MKKGDKFFLLGVFLALAIGVLALDPTLLEAVARKVTRGIQARELRMAQDLGVFKPESLRRNTINAPISHREFGLILKEFLKLLGAPAGYSIKTLDESGVFAASQPKKTLSRKQAVESACRALIHLADVGIISLQADEKASFPDYNPPAKYQPAMGFLKGKGALRGYPDGSLRSNKSITTRESVCLLYRMYEQVAAQICASQGQSQGVGPGKGQDQSPDQGNFHFVDLPLDHPVVEKLRRLNEFGAFDIVKLGVSFDGDGPIQLVDLGGIISGILSKAGKPTDLFELGLGTKNHKSGGWAERKDLAILVGHLARMLDEKPGSEEVPQYLDVLPTDAEFGALEALGRQGLRMGYSNGRFGGVELVSWFEMVGVLNAFLEKHATALGQKALEEPAQTTDFEEFAALIRAKKQRIRSILAREPRYQR